MEVAPSTESVFQGVQALYTNPNKDEKEKASKWLEEFQKSVYSWSICDELLQQKRDINSCYFAAQTMRRKIQNSFHELPASSHESLRDSLIVHISQITTDTSRVIVTQLCLALADLALLMPTWQSPVLSLIEKLSVNSNTIWPLLVVITLIPEEINSRYLRLGANRRKDILKDLETNSRTVAEFLIACLKNCNHYPDIQMDVVKCFTSWISIHAISLYDITDNAIIAHSFNLLNDQNTDAKLHDVATDCLCSLVQCLEANNNQEVLETQILTGISSLEDAYHMAVAHEDLDKAINYCRLFTALSEAFLDKMVNSSNGQTPHFSVKTLDWVLNCVGHYDYEVAEITFNLWFKLSENLYQKNDDGLSSKFVPHFERLVGALYRHAQMEPDHEGLIDDTDTFYEFRLKVSDLIKDVVFILGSSNVFKSMFMSLQDPAVSWECSEAALFVMQNVARNLSPDENLFIPKVIEAILNLPENTHLAVRYTSILLLGELCDWIDRHPELLEATLNYLLFALQHKSGLASAAAKSLQIICSSCKTHMICHIDGLVQIAKSLDSFEISNESAIGLLKGISVIVARTPNDQVANALREICSFQLAPLCQLLESNVKPEKGTRSDPSFWLDRLAALLQHTQVNIRENEIHPSVSIITDIWPVVSNILDRYQSESNVMERSCRLLRYAVRGIGTQSSHLLEPLVKQIVHLYSLQQHSSFLYLGSILVDEFAREPTCTNGLLDMLTAFIEPTFKILQVENGLKNHPDTVEDFFRLCTRFLQRCSVKFLESAAVNPIIQCALLACTLDHRDANFSVMKFFCSLISCGRADSKDNSQHLVHQIIQMNGESLVLNLIHASVFCLHASMLADVAGVICELKSIDQEMLSQFLKNALNALPKKNSGGCITATEVQLHEFHQNILKSDTSKAMTHVLKDFSKLYR